MERKHRRQPVVLALAPVVQGVGYAVFEGPLTLVDWGVRYARTEKNWRGVENAKQLMGWYQPQIVVIEDATAEGSRRRPRIRRLVRSIALRAEKKSIRVSRWPRGQVRECFTAYGATTKHEIACKLSEWLPELKPSLPPPRKIWMSEDPHMGMFDAVSLAITFYHFRGQSRRRKTVKV